jgi:hypothetical protein
MENEFLGRVCLLAFTYATIQDTGKNSKKVKELSDVSILLLHELFLNKHGISSTYWFG